MSNKSTTNKMRVWHRYLGFFLAGIMGIYALSGIVLIFRNTSFLKQEKLVVKQIAPNTPIDSLGKKLEMKQPNPIEVKDGKMIFKDGFYDIATGHAEYKTKTLPYFIGKMTKLHKANSNDPLFFLNVFFAVSLLFFVISSFFMFTIKSAPFKRGVYFAIAGFILALVLLFI
jgi:hypothetical protein